MALPAVIAILNALPGDDAAAIEARCTIVGWAVSYAPDQARGLAGPLESTFENPALAPALRTRIAVMFASNGAGLSSRAPEDWAARALSEGARALTSHEPFQLIWRQIDNAADWNRLLPEALAAASY